MRRGLTAALLVAAPLLLSGCFAPAGLNEASATETGPAKEWKPDLNHYGMSLVKPQVEGTELLCIKENSYDSIECNWDLWNKTRETTP